MCRNIKPLFNFDPPASSAEIQAAALQYVRKVSGQHKPSAVNTPAIEAAVAAVAEATQELFDHLSTTAPAKNRDIEADKSRARSAKRFPKA